MAKRNTRTGAGMQAPVPPSIPSSGSCKGEGASSVVETITTATFYYCSDLSAAPTTGGGSCGASTSGALAPTTC